MWCPTCSEEQNDYGNRATICFICGDDLQATPTTSSSSTQQPSSDPSPNAAVALFNEFGNIFSNQNNTIPNRGTDEQKTGTSLSYLKQIPRIVIHENSHLLNASIVQCTIPSSSSSSSSSSIHQMDAIPAEFGPSPPYDITGELKSFLSCENDILLSQKNHNKIQLQNQSKSSMIAYMIRGKGISFAERAIYAQKVGAKALIIANHVSTWPFVMKDSKQIIKDTSIPVVMISQKSHLKLSPFLTTPMSCRIHVNPNPLDEEDANACIICRDPYQVGDTVMRLPTCFHTFHESCAMAWLTKRNTCPYCRKELPSENNREKEHFRSVNDTSNDERISNNSASIYG